MNLMTRRRFLIITGTSALVAPRAARAQPTGRARTIGILASAASRVLAFEEGLRELGWVEGNTVRFERRLGVDYREYLRLAKELVRVPIDVIFVGNAPAVRAAREATSTIPIVMVTGDPVSSGFVASLARPSANVTGLAIMHTELSGKRLEILAQALPTARRIAVLANPENPSTPAMLDATERSASALGIRLLRFEAAAPEKAASALAAAAREHADALVVLGDPMFFSNRRRLVEAATQHRLPSMWEWREYVEAGGLLAYGPLLDDLYRRAATYVDKILKGAKPADLPVEQPTTFELVINMKTAKALGLTIPQSLRLRADQLIE
jgi:putative ABC transport system substrate-binding protein